MKQENYLPIINNVVDMLSSELYKELKTVPPSESYQLQTSETMELVSIKTMGKPDFWWVLSLYNDILNPLNPISQKQIIMIPDKQKLGLLLNKTRLQNA